MITIPAKWKSLLSPLNLHLGGALLLLALNIYLIVQIAISLGIAHSNDANALTEAKLQLHTATVKAQPLRGLDKKLTAAESDAVLFEKSRMPVEQSTVIAELGDVAHKNNVRLSRVEYSPAPTVEANLTEMGMDASLIGDYRPLVQFMNALERDKVFFIINGITLSGQQGGTVTLKIRVTTWLRAGVDSVTTAETTDEKPVKTPTAKVKTPAAPKNKSAKGATR